MTETCICGSGKSFTHCCQPLLRGTDQAAHPEQLMRSRYTAYALGGYGQYLLRTWFPAMAKGQTAESLDSSDTDWRGLVVHESGVTDDSGFVAFTAYYREAGELQQMHERSEFSRVGGRWFYIGGDVSYQTPRVSRNDQCPCGSGKKYKKCCMP